METVISYAWLPKETWLQIEVRFAAAKGQRRRGESGEEGGGGSPRFWDGQPKARHTPGLGLPFLRAGGLKTGHLLGTRVQLPLESAVRELLLSGRGLPWMVLPPLVSRGEAPP